MRYNKYDVNIVCERERVRDSIRRDRGGIGEDKQQTQQVLEVSKQCAVPVRIAYVR